MHLGWHDLEEAAGGPLWREGPGSARDAAGGDSNPAQKQHGSVPTVCWRSRALRRRSGRGGLTVRTIKKYVIYTPAHTRTHTRTRTVCLPCWGVDSVPSILFSFGPRVWNPSCT